MTVRVIVKTHGCPTTVTVEGQEPVRIDHHREQTFNIDGNASISIAEEEPSAEHGHVEASPDAPLDPNNVPGRAENDALLGAGENPAEQPTSETRSSRRQNRSEDPAS